jgi:hypothetical protein
MVGLLFQVLFQFQNYLVCIIMSAVRCSSAKSLVLIVLTNHSYSCVAYFSLELNSFLPQINMQSQYFGLLTRSRCLWCHSRPEMMPDIFPSLLGCQVAWFSIDIPPPPINDDIRIQSLLLISIFLESSHEG